MWTESDQQHIAKHHQDIPAKMEMKFQCRDCLFHIDNMSAMNHYVCFQCGKYLMSWHELTQHKKTHSYTEIIVLNETSEGLLAEGNQ